MLIGLWKSVWVWWGLIKSGRIPENFLKMAYLSHFLVPQNLAIDKLL